MRETAAGSGWVADPFPPYGAGESGATLDQLAGIAESIADATAEIGRTESGAVPTTMPSDKWLRDHGTLTSTKEPKVAQYNLQETP